jgi:hypothetical protein
VSHTDLHQALDAVPKDGGLAIVEDPAGEVRVDVVEADRLGVRVRGVSVGHAESIDVAAEAATLPARLRAIPEHLVPVEVSPVLGGATIRTAPDDMRRRQFFEIEVTPTQTQVKRFKVAPDGSRAPVDWTLTRDQLEGLIGQVRPPVTEE